MRAGERFWHLSLHDGFGALYVGTGTAYGLSISFAFSYFFFLLLSVSPRLFLSLHMLSVSPHSRAAVARDIRVLCTRGVLWKRVLAKERRVLYGYRHVGGTLAIPISLPFLFAVLCLPVPRNLFLSLHLHSSLAALQVVVRVIKREYHQPYAEYRQFIFPFQIVIQCAKNDLRPTIPPSTPAPLADFIRLVWHKVLTLWWYEE